MEEKIESLMLQILAQYGDDPVVREALTYHKECSLNKTAESDVLGNSMWSNMLDGALKAIEIVAIASMDWKLMTVVKIFSSWFDEKRAEKKKREQDLTLGVNYNITHPGVSVTTDPYNGRSYY